ncbi:ABC transporter ATP-binding protein [Candidatus Woesearchaeota archaeon]|nr:ABC transporter ATP-binding protein [Candidatus Woesearchaeota archaeon]
MNKEGSWATKILTIVPEIKQGVASGFLISLFYESIKFIPIILLKFIIDYFVTGKTVATQLIYAISGVFISYVVLELIEYFSKRAAFRWNLQYEKTILQKAEKKLLELDIGYHETFNTGAQVSKISKGAHRLAELIWFAFEEFIPTLVQLLMTVGLLLYEQWLLAVIFGVFVPLIIWITIYEGKKVQPLRQHYHQKYDEAVGELGETLFNISTVKDYVQEKQQIKKFERLLQEYSALAVARHDYSSRVLTLRDLLINGGRVATLGFASYLVVQGELSAGSLVLVYTLTEKAFLSLYRIGRLYSYLGDAMESINRLANLLQEKATVANIPNAQTVSHLEGAIEFRGTVFSYGGEKEVLNNFTLKIEPHQIVALVGRSGSGKSTVAKLLLRNYDVSTGEILVDEKDIRTYKIEDYKKRIAVVSQQVEIFNRSIMDNIRFAKLGATREEAISAAKKAHAHEFIMDFPQGYDTIVGEKGVRLSGGQKQRVSIARVLLKSPDMYIFDEATSSLDSESEQYIQKSIFSIAGQKTTIIIAHRLSTIRKANLIVVMDKGRVVEQGTYEQLLQNKGAFWKMIQLQEGAELRE